MFDGAITALQLHPVLSKATSKVPAATFALPMKCRLEFVLESPRISGASEQGYGEVKFPHW